jgi:NADH-quinone oxidoreductase subunit N
MSALIVISVLGVLLLYAGFSERRWVLAPLGIAGLLIAAVLFHTGWYVNMDFMSSMLEFDPFSLAFSQALIAITIMIFLYGIDYYKWMREKVAEQYALMVFSLIGAILLTSYSDLLMLFLGTEIMSIPLYILAGGKRDSLRSGEAAFKYFLQGSFASGFFLLGITLLYGATASLDLVTVQEFAATVVGREHMLYFLGLFFTIAGLAFKVAAVPFHFWSPDVYEGSPTLLTAFMSTVVKAAAFAAFYRFVEGMDLPNTLHAMLVAMTGLTLFLGNVVALRQTQFKRMLAYSSIAHTGFLLFAFLSTGPVTAQVLFYYLITYAFATIGIFIVLTIVKRTAGGDEHIRVFRGLYRKDPWIAIATMILLLSLAGIPLTAGFIAKYKIFMLGIGAGYIGTTIFAVLMAILGVYYYMIVIREAFTPSATATKLVITPINGLLIAFSCATVIGLAMFPEILSF